MKRKSVTFGTAVLLGSRMTSELKMYPANDLPWMGVTAGRQAIQSAFRFRYSAHRFF